VKERPAVIEAPRRILSAALSVRASSRISREVARGAFSDKVVVAGRATGFVSRLGELLNAFGLAEIFGAQFRFEWPFVDQFGITPAEKVFSERFLSNHHGSVAALDSLHEVFSPITRGDVQQLLKPGIDGWRIRKRYAMSVAGFQLPQPLNYPGAYAGVELSPRLEDVRQRVARSGDVETVIHLRRGDILSGRFRFGVSTVHKKAISLPILLTLRTRIGRASLHLIGNDVRLNQYVAEQLGGCPVVNLVSTEAGQTDAADVRDFHFLTRARHLVGADSAFVRVAALIAGVKPIQLHDCITTPEATDAVLDFVTSGSGDEFPFETALAVKNLFAVWPESVQRLSAADIRLLLSAALADDPDDERLAKIAAIQGDDALRTGITDLLTAGRISLDEHIFSRDAGSALRAV